MKEKLSGDIMDYIRLHNKLGDREISSKIRDRFGVDVKPGAVKRFRAAHGLTPGEAALTTRMVPKAPDTDFIYIFGRKLLYGYADYDPDGTGATFCVAFLLERPYYVTIGPDKRRCERDLVDKIRQNSRSLGRRKRGLPET